MTYAECENEVLRIRLKETKQAIKRVKELLKTASIDPFDRLRILEELKVITEYGSKK